MNVIDPHELSVAEASAAFALAVYPVYAALFGLAGTILLLSAAISSVIIGMSTVYTARIRATVRNATRAVPGLRGAVRMLYLPMTWLAVIVVYREVGVSRPRAHWAVVALLSAFMANPASALMASRAPLRWSVGALVPWMVIASVSLLSLAGRLNAPMLSVLVCALTLLAAGLFFEKVERVVRKLHSLPPDREKVTP